SGQVDDVGRLESAQRGGAGLGIGEIDDVRADRREGCRRAAGTAKHDDLGARFMEQARQVPADEPRGAGYGESVVAKVERIGFWHCLFSLGCCSSFLASVSLPACGALAPACRSALSRIKRDYRINCYGKASALW